MRIVIATSGLGARGGVHSYLDAVLGEFVALGHEVHVVAPEFGRPQALGDAGAHVWTSCSDVPGGVDAVVAFVDRSAFEARAAFPDVPLLAVSHGPWYAQDVPPVEVEPCAVVALSDLSLDRLRESALAERGVPLVRLTQPAELVLPSPPEDNVLPDVPEHAVVVAHRLTSRRDPLARALEARGISVSFAGGADQDDDVSARILGADIVVGIGRVVLEGMAAGRACLVLDEVGGGDWLTPDTYAAYEATGFVLGRGAGIADGDLSTLLDGYRPQFGRAGRELVLRHHAPAAHAARLLGLLHGAPAPVGPFDAQALRHEAALRLERSGRRIARTLEGFAAATGERDARAELTAQNTALRAELERASAQLQTVQRSRSWRLTAPLRRVAALGRRRRAPR